MIFLYPTCYFLIYHIGKTSIGKKAYTKISEYISKLHILKDPKDQTKLFLCRQLSYVLVITVVFNLVVLLANTTQSGILKDSYYIKRPSYGEKEKDVSMVIDVEEENSLYNTKIPIKERHYTKREDIERVFKQAENYLDNVILYKNKSCNHVTTKVNLPSIIDSLCIKVKWDLEGQDIIQADGTIQFDDPNNYREGIVVTIRAIISYYDEEEYYPINLNVYPIEATKQEQLLNKILEQITRIQLDQPENEYIKLPDTIESKHISYREPREDNSMIFNILGVAAIVCILCGSYTQLQKENKKREKQMLLDYPSIINKIVLLVGAGMTVKNAWGKICMKYEETLDVCKNKRYAYEEMLATYYDLCNGVPEAEAYDYFGRRIQLIPYMKLSSLLTQNIKKGPTDLLRSMEYEAIQSIEDRKELAKKLGEEAGTKLLAPMILMLGIVLVMLMVPAFMQM